MNSKEKYLYHQIHPLKLATDWSAAAIALYFLWQHVLGTALLILFVPSILVSFYLIRSVNLERQKNSAFGKYIEKHMTRPVELVRFFGMFIAALGAWHHVISAIVLGIALILFAWVHGKLMG